MRRSATLYRVTRDYFDDAAVNRERLLWAIATRRQLERWEPLVAAFVRNQLDHRGFDGVDVWSAAIERHFALVAARNLFRALDLPPVTRVPIEPTLRAELIEGRNLHEHWLENMPVFNVWPRVTNPPHRSAKDFAARNPKHGPYSWLEFTNKAGAQLLPHVSAQALHELLDAVEAEVLGGNDALRLFVPPRAPSPWLHVNGEWWPKDAVG